MSHLSPQATCPCAPTLPLDYPVPDYKIQFAICNQIDITPSSQIIVLNAPKLLY